MINIFAIFSKKIVDSAQGAPLFIKYYLFSIGAFRFEKKTCKVLEQIERDKNLAKFCFW